MLPSQHALFEIPPGVCYLDGASYSPLPRPVRAAGEHGLLTKSQPWKHPEARADAPAERTRAAAARLIGTAPGNVAILGSVSQGIATAARTLALPIGHRILRMEQEFPSQSLIWDRLAADRGLVLEIVPRPADGDWTAALLAAITRPFAGTTTRTASTRRSPLPAPAVTTRASAMTPSCCPWPSLGWNWCSAGASRRWPNTCAT